MDSERTLERRLIQYADSAEERDVLTRGQLEPLKNLEDPERIFRILKIFKKQDAALSMQDFGELLTHYTRVLGDERAPSAHVDTVLQVLQNYWLPPRYWQRLSEWVPSAEAKQLHQEYNRLHKVLSRQLGDEKLSIERLVQILEMDELLSGSLRDFLTDRHYLNTGDALSRNVPVMVETDDARVLGALRIQSVVTLAPKIFKACGATHAPKKVFQAIVNVLGKDDTEEYTPRKNRGRLRGYFKTLYKQRNKAAMKTLWQCLPSCMKARFAVSPRFLYYGIYSKVSSAVGKRRASSAQKHDHL